MRLVTVRDVKIFAIHETKHGDQSETKHGDQSSARGGAIADDRCPIGGFVSFLFRSHLDISNI